MLADAEALKEKLDTAMSEGTSFKDALKAAEKEAVVTQIKDFSYQGRSYSPKFGIVKFTNAGEIAPFSFTPSEEEAEKVTLIYISKKELVKDTQYHTGLDDTVKSAEFYSRYRIFGDWLYKQLDETDVTLPVISKE